MFSDPPVSYVNHAEAIAMPALTGEVAQEQSMDDKMGENYFAVLLLVAFLGLLLIGTRLWGRATVFRVFCTRLCGSNFPAEACGPAAF